MKRTQVAKSNQDNVTKIIKVLNTKTPVSRTDLIMKQFYEKLLSGSVLQDERLALCINHLVGYPSDKPGKIYVWPDNLVKFHKFLTGKTKTLVYYYPDYSYPNRYLWKVEAHYDANYRLTAKSKTQILARDIVPVSEQKLAKIVQF